MKNCEKTCYDYNERVAMMEADGVPNAENETRADVCAECKKMDKK